MNSQNYLLINQKISAWHEYRGVSRYHHIPTSNFESLPLLPNHQRMLAHLLSTKMHHRRTEIKQNQTFLSKGTAHIYYAASVHCILISLRCHFEHLA